MAKSRSRRSNHPVRGWGAMSPRGARQRVNLYKRCGKKCFLRPSDLGFPVCARSARHCRANCAGLAAAEYRAGQYGYTNIESKARKIAKNRRCGHSKSYRRSKGRRSRSKGRRSRSKGRRSRRSRSKGRRSRRSRRSGRR
jgi:hypothetical protein